MRGSIALHLDAEEACYTGLEGTWLCEAALWSLWMHVGRMMAESAWDWGFSDTWQLIMQIVLVAFGTLFSSHIVCCLWFFVGRHGPTLQWTPSMRLTTRSS